MATSFGCAVSSFPQTYLGLPLSPLTLCLSDYGPIISKCDRQLFGWCGRCLLIGSRLILVNSVLTAMISHAMCAGALPAGVIEAIDRRRRAFFWTGEESCTGGQCKVAWSDVCRPKALGGLGILSISSQNTALLSKFLIKIHSPSDEPWVCWFRRFYGWSANRDLGDPHHLDTPIWKCIVAGLPSFRKHTILPLAMAMLPHSGPTPGLTVSP